MAVITQGKAKLGDLIDKRLNDGTEDTGEARAAAKQYYLGLIEEDLQLNETVDVNESLDSNELAVLGFLKGYQACLSARGIV